MPTASEVLFVCVHNAGRSQMAAALLHYHAKGAVRSRLTVGVKGTDVGSSRRRPSHEEGAHARVEEDIAVRAAAGTDR